MNISKLRKNKRTSISGYDGSDNTTRSFREYPWFLYKPLPMNTLKNLHSHKYQAGESTILDNIIKDIYWVPVSKFLPRWIAPNLITLTGFLTILPVTILMLYYSPYFTNSCPTWLYFLASIAIFIYQTMDSLDGLQARQTNQSTPLGQIFDHGTDAFVVTLISICVCVALSSGYPFFIHMIVCQSLPFYLAQWSEKYTHVLNTSVSVVGITEGQIVGIFAILLCCINPTYWTESSIQIQLPIIKQLMYSFAYLFKFIYGKDNITTIYNSYLITLPFTITSFIITNFILINTYNKTKQFSLLKRLNIFSEILPIIITIVTTVLGYRYGAFIKYPFISPYIIGITLSYLSLTRIISCVTKHTINTIFFSIFYSFTIFSIVQDVKDISIFRSMTLSACISLLILYPIYYAICIVYQISTFLNVNILHYTPRLVAP